jgi:hypothetical protein
VVSPTESVKGEQPGGSDLQLHGLKTVIKTPEFFRGQGAIRFKSGAYTQVREHFEPNWNAVIVKIMVVLNQF